ncbi:MAG: hypothetical protein HN936_13245 [Bacteroidetes bacterium]|nr:hypothetical protein [Gammaproteobacteria bacterium]MBT7094207.1 hypothetical protein [Bacteroidota bacterium]
MAKKQIIKVIGYTDSNLIARPYEAAQVVKFEAVSGAIMMYENPAGDYRVITRKGSYVLKPDPSQYNRFVGTVGNGIQCHFMKKKIVGKLIYWA